MGVIEEACKFILLSYCLSPKNLKMKEILDTQQSGTPAMGQIDTAHVHIHSWFLSTGQHFQVWPPSSTVWGKNHNE